MTTWLKDNWRWALLNVVALAALAYVLTGDLFRYSVYTAPDQHRDAMLESGKWAIRFLLLSLAMSPLNTYLRWRWAIPLRKPAGLWAFGFGALHFGLFLVEENINRMNRLALPLPTYIVLGIIGLLILAVMAATSNRWAMKWLGKNWKRLHRFVYAAVILVVLHALLAIEMSKKVFAIDPQAGYEMRLYLILMTALLLLRLPPARSALQGGLRLARRSFLPRDRGTVRT